MISLRVIAGFVIGFGLLVSVGCQSSNTGTHPAEATMSPPGKYVVATTGNGTATIFIPSDNGTVKLMSNTDIATCPDCQADAVKYFQTGILAPKCPTCGATRVVVTSHN